MNDFFCSALMTFLIEEASWLDKPIPWDLVKPKDYDDGGKMETLLLEEIIFEPKHLVWDAPSSWTDLMSHGAGNHPFVNWLANHCPSFFVEVEIKEIESDVKEENQV